MIQNQNANISAPGMEQRTPWPVGFRLHFWALAATFLLGAALLHGQANNISIGATATQAVITYTAPFTGPCVVEVHEGDSSGPLVHDVDPSLFPGSNIDSRTANLTSGRRRIFVVGKRTAEIALDGFRYSRALQAATVHTYKITCGEIAAQGQFSTTNAPLGMSFNDPLPSDPLQPGQYAWPEFTFTDRNQYVIDPLTGIKVKLLDSPRDSYNSYGSGNFRSASNSNGGTDWTTPGAITADDAASATYSGTSQAWLFAELGATAPNGSIHDALTPAVNTLVPKFKAYCSSPDCVGASSDDRSIQFCLTVDSLTCASDMLEMALAACTGSNCGTTLMPAITSPKSLLGDWFQTNHGVSKINVTDLQKRSGNVNRNGASVTQINGDRFNINWNPGSPITINGTVYTIASVNHDQSLTLSGSPAGSDSAVPYLFSNAGILIRKKTAATQQITIQYLAYDAEQADAPLLESGGDEDSYANCSPVEVAGPNNEMGWHCNVSSGIYWIGKDTGTVSRLGRTVPPYNPAQDGWNQQPCFGGSYWNWQDPNSFYCPTNSVNGHLYVLKFTYTGSNTDIGDLDSTRPVVQCSTSPAPCWTITNLTPGSAALDLQMVAFHPDWAASHFHTNTISLFGRMGPTNSLLFMARRDQNNDTLAFLFRFDLNSGLIQGALPTWRKWPLRWSAMHGPFNINDPNWVQVSATNFRGPSSGNDFLAGNGPYYSLITTPGGIDASNHPCPARPSDSPIAVSDWPVGNQCVTVTVDGEPGDPTPFKYANGTVSVTGTTVVGNGVYWTPIMDGSQMVIDGNSYTFSYVSYDHGTLDRAPGTIVDPHYVLQLEQVNNPKVGNPAFGYLQDAEVRDIFCATNMRDCAFNYPANEFVRLILKSGNTWTLQRGYSGGLPQREMYALPQGAWLIAVPASCYFGTIYPCPDSRVVWDAVHDPYGYNATQSTVVADPKEKGCCHGTRQNGLNANVGLVCPHTDVANTGCYYARYSGEPASFTDEGFAVSNNPLFHGMAGLGSPNPVDSHPSHNQIMPEATANEFRWIADSRVLLGNDATPVSGTLLSGSLYKFTTGAGGLSLHHRTLPTLAACGANPLLDVSGPSTILTDGSADNYKFCVASAGGECVSGSAAGDVYVNCPQIKYPYCSFPGVGSSDSEARDICIADMGAHTLNLTQVGIDKPDPDGVNSRRVTTGFGHYKWINQFWNTKVLPNGRWLFVWTVFLQNQRNSMLLVKLPPFPVGETTNRGDYIPFKVTIPPPSNPAITNAVVEFWYDKTIAGTNVTYHCYARGEKCVQGSSADFKYQSENPSGVACAHGCTVPVQALSQRILYYQVLMRDASNNVVSRMDPAAVAIK